MSPMNAPSISAAGRIRVYAIYTNDISVFIEQSLKLKTEFIVGNLS